MRSAAVTEAFVPLRRISLEYSTTYVKYLPSCRNGGGGVEIMGSEPGFCFETQGENLTPKYR